MKIFTFSNKADAQEFHRRLLGRGVSEQNLSLIQTDTDSQLVNYDTPAQREANDVIETAKQGAAEGMPIGAAVGAVGGIALAGLLVTGPITPLVMMALGFGGGGLGALSGLGIGALGGAGAAALDQDHLPEAGSKHIPQLSDEERAHVQEVVYGGGGVLLVDEGVLPEQELLELAGQSTGRLLVAEPLQQYRLS